MGARTSNFGIQFQVLVAHRAILTVVVSIGIEGGSRSEVGRLA